MENVEYWAFGTKYHKEIFAYPAGTPKKKIMEDAWDWVSNFGTSLGVTVEKVTEEEARVWKQ